MNKTKIILPITMVFLMVLPVVNQLFCLWSFEQVNENRNLHSFPEFDITNPEVFPSEFDEYFTDAFSFRTPLLSTYQRIKFEVFRISPSPKATILGNNGWMFMSAKEKEILSGKRDFSEEQLIKLSSEWSKRKQLLDSLEIFYQWYILPMKHYVYEEELPFNLIIAQPKRVETLTSFLNSQFSDLVIDPTNALRLHRKSRPLYYKNDNHWNHHAAFITLELMLKQFEAHFPEHHFKIPTNFSWKSSLKVGGYHAGAIGKPELTEVVEEPMFNSSKVYNEGYGFEAPSHFAYPNEYEKTYINPDGNGLTILVIGDSFTAHFRPFIPEVFSKSVFIFDAWQYQLNQEIILTVKPDIVLWESLETHIDHVISEE